ncbi:hypothetical protein [Paenibacillus mendelii]|uniref:Uncharacterized protein n=1 Tax=Paenibacillus mendelii TaxID=206163 RepID=A0ABV6JA30_9BACL|nr:hypothetical protein [Paenibacillus mendelii]MCQ6563984.1 hypothetical protein [Paenibacillus mendelii]
MPTEHLMLRALRKEDFLNLTFELVNLHTEGTPLHIVKTDTNQPALLIVHFPPQHIVEALSYPSEHPFQAMLAGPSRIVFKLPDDQDRWPLTLKTLLNWQAYSPVLAGNALPAGATTGPGLNPPGPEDTALEIPTGMYLSPDEAGIWSHAFSRAAHNGRFELWHTRLGERNPASDGAFREGGNTRVIWAPDLNIPFPSSLTQKERKEIAYLSADFSIPSLPLWIFQRYGDGEYAHHVWRTYLTEYGLPHKYIPQPVHTHRLMLSSFGAWAKLEGAWEYPTIIAGQNDHVGYSTIGLEQWQHIVAQGRDQYVKTVKKAYLCDTGHRVSITTITERTFDGSLGVTALLEQYQYIEILEPVKDYSNSALASAYNYGGREMPFRRIHITNPSTPQLDEFSVSTPFWPKQNGEHFHFQMVAEDWEGNIVNFERPLLCVPLPDGQADWNNIVQDYNADKNRELRTVSIQAQSVALAETTKNSRGKTTLKTDRVVFEAQLVKGNASDQLPKPHPLFLPTVKEAKVNLPAVDRLLGRPMPVDISFDEGYLAGGFERAMNKGEVFAKLSRKVELPFPAEKAGGLVKPDTSIQALSRSLGPVADPESIKTGKFDTSIFDKARFLGGITLKDILQKVDFDPDAIIEASEYSPEKLKEKLDIPEFRIEIPIISNRALFPPGVDHTVPTVAPIAMETRFVWKPCIQDYCFPETNPFFKFLTKKQDTKFTHDAQLIVNTRLVFPTDGTASSYEFNGCLKDFAMNFVGALTLRFASLSFCAKSGKKMDVSAKGMDLIFEGDLQFVNTIRNILPADGFSDPPFLDVTSSGIRAGYTLGVPSLGVGIFSLQNISLGASLTLPFIDQPAGVRFSISERHNPFLVTVGVFGGGGFFTLALNAHGIEQLEAAIEFGGNVSLNLGVASGGIYVMAGIYFGMAGNDVKLTGYLRCGGYLSVLGLIGVSVEFYMGLTYRKKGIDSGEVWGQASVTVGVQVAFLSKSVTLTIERKFAGAAGDPTFDQMVGPSEWEQYCLAFA